ncbi:MAG: type II toxin-antitoxin system HicA family toxin [Lachnospiraceae bacterium]|nr:type II toxin-antitoxin system HicA family toxin [Lachnospiraceae bacterium]MDD7378987.1 type II toxin-antitoxin system HicA family toxin [Lachnospiraceae bacterium]MDY4617424.1 type II toxin-antitoxin system HicA family toxin [Lachnospiraceae bacterium]
MPKKRDLIEKLCRKPIPRNFSKRELDILMGKCDRKKFQGGRGTGIGFVHSETKRILQFDEPHPGNELYDYQIKKTIQFLKDIGEIE